MERRPAARSEDSPGSHLWPWPRLLSSPLPFCSPALPQLPAQYVCLSPVSLFPLPPPPYTHSLEPASWENLLLSHGLHLPLPTFTWQGINSLTSKDLAILVDYNPKLGQPINTHGLSQGLRANPKKKWGNRKIMPVITWPFFPCTYRYLMCPEVFLQTSNSLLIVLRSLQEPR